MECYKCKTIKPDSDFKVYKRRTIGIKPTCIDCKRKERREYNKRTNYDAYHKYEKTHDGFLMRLYRNMESRVTGIQKKCIHLYLGLDLLPRQDFYKWAKESKDFYTLYDNYKQSGYNRKFAPSVDRIDTKKGYTIDNMRWLTHSQNSALSKNNKEVYQYDKNGVLLNEYESATLAAKMNPGFNISNISFCCTGRIKTAYGYIWKYKQKLPANVV